MFTFIAKTVGIKYSSISYMSEADRTFVILINALNPLYARTVRRSY